MGYFVLGRNRIGAWQISGIIRVWVRALSWFCSCARCWYCGFRSCLKVLVSISYNVIYVIYIYIYVFVCMYN